MWLAVRFPVQGYAVLKESWEHFSKPQHMQSTAWHSVGESNRRGSPSDTIGKRYETSYL